MKFTFTRKGVTLIVLLFAGVTATKAQTRSDAQITSQGEIKTIMLRDLKIENGNVISDFISGKTAFKITGTHISAETGGGYLINCLDPQTPINSAVYIADTQTSETDNKEHSYIVIENKGTNPIVSVDFVGLCSTNEHESSMVCAISDESETYYAPEESGKLIYSRIEGRRPGAMEYVAQSLFFNGDDRSACNYSFDVPSTIYKLNRQGWATEATITGVEESTKFIRLNWSASTFAGINTVQRGKPMLLLGLKIHVIDKTPVGIPQENVSLTVNRIADGVFSLSDKADISIYNINGNIVLKQTATDNFSLQGNPNGIYILKAKAKKMAITKKIVF